MTPRQPELRPDTLTVSALSERIKELLEGQLYDLWVEAELGAVKVHQSGHVYLTLKDGDARIDAVIWRTTARRIRHRPQIGEQVLVFGRISVYPPRGCYQLVIEQLLPAGGVGPLQAAYDQLRGKLAAEGLFDPGRKRRPPLLPRGVGVVTSPTGAARFDIEQVLHRRAPHVPIIIYPAIVQGPAAAADVAAGIRAVCHHPLVDVVIVGRGGGSLEDLWAFNEEAVARAIHECPVPVISAVGHETDVTIADLVADLRAPTPSAAAEAAVPVRDDLLAGVAGLVERLERALARRVERCREGLRFLERRLGAGLAFDARTVALQRLEARLLAGVRRRIASRRQQLEQLDERTRARHPAVRLTRARQRLGSLAARLERAGGRRVTQAREALGPLAARLHALSPVASLGRGYSITRRDGRALRGYDEVQVGDEVEVILHRGRLHAQVTRRLAPPEEDG